MSDVAARAGVSLKSVSRVVNGEPHVSSELAERVRAAAAELGFRPNTSARALAAGSGSLVGFVQVDAANPFFAAVHRGFEEVARAAGYLVISGSTDAEPGREVELVEALVEARVAGMLVAAAEGADAQLQEEIDLGAVVVCVDRLLPDLECDTVVSDNRDSTRRAVTELVDIGHERIAFLGGTPEVWTAAERFAGYQDAMAAAGLPSDDGGLVVRDVGTVAGAEEAARSLLGGPTPPTAVFAGQDRIGMGVIRALHDLDLQHRIAVTVFDEIPMAEQLDPSVTVLAQDPVEMGRRAGELLVGRLAGHRTGPHVLEVVPTRLVRRRSSRIPPG